MAKSTISVNDAFLAVRVETLRYAEVRDMLLGDASVEGFRADRMTELASALAHGLSLDVAVDGMRRISDSIVKSYTTVPWDVAEARGAIAAREGAAMNA